MRDIPRKNAPEGSTAKAKLQDKLRALKAQEDLLQSGALTKHAYMENTLAELQEALPRGGRLLGLDLGEKTIGLALSNSGLSLASPIGTVRRKKFTQDAEWLRAVIEEKEVAGLVFGLPVNMDGSEGKRCQSTRQFARNLEEIAGIELPYAFWDERLSTAAVERFLVQEADMTRKRRGEVVDKMAAAYILQGALDSLAAL